MDPNRSAPQIARARLLIRGIVQGVGFRPFVFRLAHELGLGGWVANAGPGVIVEAEGAPDRLALLRQRIENDPPPGCLIESLEMSWLDPRGTIEFTIRPSQTSGGPTAWVRPDVATCPDCLREIFDPTNRRYLYAFTNCTRCGPRYSIVESLPYDRPHTSMKGFRMCPRCQAEYDDPANRRFHAQPNACPDCGPQLALRDPAGHVLQTGHQALLDTARALRDGAIVALKGLGGFHLLVVADRADAILRLRQRKQREEKPLALMVPSPDHARALCHLSPDEARLLASPEAPIVLLRRRDTLMRELLGGATSPRAPQEAGNEPPAPGAPGGRALPSPGSWAPTRVPTAEAGASPAILDHAAAEAIAPRNPCFGVMLPYTPLHHLLLAELGRPVVATSGNRSDEPICIDECEALERLAGLPDIFLVHNRPIVRHVDDSIVRIVAGREMVLRRARGFAPLPIPCTHEPSAVGRDAQPRASRPSRREEKERRRLADLPTSDAPVHGEGDAPGSMGAGSPIIVGVGAHLKNTVALAVGPHVFLSQHIGDLDTPEALAAHRRVLADLRQLYGVTPTLVAADAHPDYASTRSAEELGLPLILVQHHYAHVLATMAENDARDPVLGVSWDGTGYGLDRTIWGGEFLRVNPTGFERIAHLRTFPLPGGDAAAREPRRSALGLLRELWGDRFGAQATDTLRTRLDFTRAEWQTLIPMLERGLHTPRTSSVGRLFDAVAALCGLRQRSSYEGQAAMELEFAIDTAGGDTGYPLPVRSPDALFSQAMPAAIAGGETDARQPWILDWTPLVEAILIDLEHGADAGRVSARFHRALVDAIVDVARRVAESCVVLTGGCFQNAWLFEHAGAQLREAGFRVYGPQRVPPNDGGIALGQAVAGIRHILGGTRDRCTKRV